MLRGRSNRTEVRGLVPSTFQKIKVEVGCDLEHSSLKDRGREERPGLRLRTMETESLESAQKRGKLLMNFKNNGMWDINDPTTSIPTLQPGKWRWGGRQVTSLKSRLKKWDIHVCYGFQGPIHNFFPEHPQSHGINLRLNKQWNQSGSDTKTSFLSSPHP